MSGVVESGMSYPYLLVASLLMDGQSGAVSPASPVSPPEEPLTGRTMPEAVRNPLVATVPQASPEIESTEPRFSELAVASASKASDEIGNESKHELTRSRSFEATRNQHAGLLNREPSSAESARRIQVSSHLHVQKVDLTKIARPIRLPSAPVAPQGQLVPIQQSRAFDPILDWSPQNARQQGRQERNKGNIQERWQNPALTTEAAIAPGASPLPIASPSPESAPVTLAFSRSLKRGPASGSQLYQQRRAALKAGKLYTRLPADSFAHDWLKATRQPTYGEWKHLLAQEAGAAARGQGHNRLGILLGDSLSLWFPSEQLPDGQLWLNQGVSGDTSGGVLRRLSAFSRTRPSTIYVMTGINDLRQGKPDWEILNNIRRIARQLRQNHPHSRIVIQSLLPTRRPQLPNSRIQSLNRQIASITRQEGAIFLNLYESFVDSQGLLRRELTTDGLHLSPQGYRVWQWALAYAEDSPTSTSDWARRSPASNPMPTSPTPASRDRRGEQRIAAYQRWLSRSRLSTVSVNETWRISEKRPEVPHLPRN